MSDHPVFACNKIIRPDNSVIDAGTVGLLDPLNAAIFKKSGAAREASESELAGFYRTNPHLAPTKTKKVE